MSFILRCLVKEVRFCHNVSVQQQRNFKKYLAPTLRELQKRKKKMPQAPPNKRSTYLEWNYGAELYALSNRLGEQLDAALLRQAMTREDYARHEGEEQARLGLADEASPSAHNEGLASEGRAFMSLYVSGYLRRALPRLPEDGIKAIHDHLLSETTLANVSFHIGTKDLILTMESPDPSPASLASALSALVGVLARHSPERASLLVRDLVVSQLAEGDVADLWAPPAPWAALEGVLGREGRAAPEPRLVCETGSGTLLAAVCVAVFSDKQLLGKGFGESIAIAKEMAAVDALRRMFGTTEAMAPLPLQPESGPSLGDLADTLSTPNPPLHEWSARNLVQLK